jgi:SAM-dependent methyltransferase
MRPEQREGVLDAARYLREVRPLDPEELFEYVEGRPHPAAVRAVLREHAPDLGVIEREDGTFVPVADGKLSPDFGGVEALPEHHGRRVEETLVDALGPGWPDGETGDRLRRRIRDVKTAYFAGDPVEYDDLTALGYVAYHLPVTYAAAGYVLADLAADGLVPTELRVLDVGAGVGGPALALADLVPTDALVDYHAVEPSAAVAVLETLLDATGRNFHATIHRQRAEAFEPEGCYDVVLFANVLSELDAPVEAAVRYLDALTETGTLVALAPADRGTATHLRTVERGVEARADATVYGPTLRLWPDESPDGECWSFERKPALAVPAVQHRLDEGERASTDSDRSPGDGEFVNVDVQYAYSLLRTDGRRRVAFRPDPDRLAPMVETERHVTDRVDCVGVTLSPDLGSDNPLFLVGDGSERVDHFAVLAEQTVLNEALVTAEYGDVLRFENALVLWNDDEAASNLVVDGETVVDRVA